MAFNPISDAGQLAAVQSLKRASAIATTSIERLATGLRVNSAKDDPGAISVSSRLVAEIKGIENGLLNIQQMQTALAISDQSNSSIENDLQAIRELALQSANSTNSAHDRSMLQIVVANLKANADSLAQSAAYNEIKLMDGTFSNKVVQLSGLSNDQISVSISSSRTNTFGEYYLLGTPHLKAGTAGSMAVSDVASQTIVIQGNANSTINVASGSSAKTLATSINLSSATTGVAGISSTQIKLDNLSNLASGKAITFKIGTTSISNSIVTSSDLSNLMANINAQTNNTAVTAQLGSSNGELILSNSDGSDILIDDFISTNTADSTVSLDVTSIDARTGNEVGSAVSVSDTISGGSHQTTVDSVIAVGQIELSSNKSFSITGHDATATKLVQNNTVNNAFIDGVDVSTQVGANNTIKTIDAAITTVNEIRANLGADINRLASVAEQLTNVKIPKIRAYSQIFDADLAEETLKLTKAQIIQDSAAAMLAQANSNAIAMAKALL